MLRAAIVGVGFMGWIHYLAYQRSTKAKLHAFCSRNPAKRQGDWTSIQGNFGPPGEQISLDGINVYEDLEEILQDADVDLVDICLPPNLHVDAVCRSLAAGKHVLCEKPLALNTEDCDRILAAADESGKKVFVAQVLPFMGEFQFAYQCFLDSRYGKPRRAYLKRVISPPDWIPNFYERDEVGGPLIDLHVHDTHFIRMLFGMPKRVACSANMQNGLVKYCNALMEFEDQDIIVSTSSGVSDQNGRPFCHGFEIQFERALLQFELSAFVDGAKTMDLTVMNQEGEVQRPELPSADEISAFTAEIDGVANAIHTGDTDPRLAGATARDAIHICQSLQNSAEQGDWVACC